MMEIIKNALVRRCRSADEVGAFLHAAIAKHDKSWVLLNLAASYWRAVRAFSYPH